MLSVSLPPTPSAEDEAVDLESLLDDTTVETTRRRRTFPKKILPHVVHALKAERKIMVGLFFSPCLFFDLPALIIVHYSQFEFFV